MNKDQRNFMSGFSSGLVDLYQCPQSLGQGALSKKALLRARTLHSRMFSPSLGADWGLENLVISLG